MTSRARQRDNPRMSPAEIVDRQLDAYNARDLERFVACFDERVQAFRPPAPEAAIEGRAALAKHYAANRFNLPGLKAEIVDRIALGNFVIDHERIFGVRDAPFEAAVAYEIAGGHIRRMWLYVPA